MEPFVFTLTFGGDHKQIPKGLEAVSCCDVEIIRGDTLDGFVVDTSDSEIRLSERLILQMEQFLGGYVSSHTDVRHLPAEINTVSFYKIADVPFARLFHDEGLLR